MMPDEKIWMGGDGDSTFPVKMQGLGRGKALTECSRRQHTLDGPGVDLKVGRNVYKDSCSISRKWNRCPREKKKSRR